MIIGVILGNSAPALVVGLILALLLLNGQRTEKAWQIEKISTRPLVIIGFGLLVYFGYLVDNQGIHSREVIILMATITGGVVCGAVASRTLRLWNDSVVGLKIVATAGTLIIWIAAVAAAVVVYGADHVAYEPLVLFVGAMRAAEQLVTIIRGVHARRTLQLPASVGVSIDALYAVEEEPSSFDSRASS